MGGNEPDRFLNLVDSARVAVQSDPERTAEPAPADEPRFDCTAHGAMAAQDTARHAFADTIEPGPAVGAGLRSALLERRG
jgi:hypothetical protein